MRMSDLFGGEAEMQEKLVQAIRNRRQELELSCSEVDDLCGFNANNGPCIEEIESDPKKMTSAVFSVASFPLELNIDDVLAVPSDDDELVKRVVDEMRRDNASVVASSGESSVDEIDYETQVPVYAILRALSEMDSTVTSG